MRACQSLGGAHETISRILCPGRIDGGRYCRGADEFTLVTAFDSVSKQFALDLDLEPQRDEQKPKQQRKDCMASEQANHPSESKSDAKKTCKAQVENSPQQ